MFPIDCPMMYLVQDITHGLLFLCWINKAFCIIYIRTCPANISRISTSHKASYFCERYTRSSVVTCKENSVNMCLAHISHLNTSLKASFFCERYARPSVVTCKENSVNMCPAHISHLSTSLKASCFCGRYIKSSVASCIRTFSIFVSSTYISSKYITQGLHVW